MTDELLTALTAFALVSSITPGPNNLLLMASGANFGFWRTIPHMLGVVLGFSLMLLLVGGGLMQVFDYYPVSRDILKTISIVYLTWLAYKISIAARPGQDSETTSRPFGFIQAAAFQWVNPKAWTMALTAISIYSPSRNLETILIIALTFALVNIPTASFWAVLGLKLQAILTDSKRLRAFNITMATLLLSSLYPVFRY